MTTPLRRRTGGPLFAMALDLVRQARHTRHWIVLVVVALVVVALVAGSASHAAVPFVVYAGL